MVVNRLGAVVGKNAVVLVIPDIVGVTLQLHFHGRIIAEKVGEHVDDAFRFGRQRVGVGLEVDIVKVADLADLNLLDLGIRLDDILFLLRFGRNGHQLGVVGIAFLLDIQHQLLRFFLVHLRGKGKISSVFVDFGDGNHVVIFV